MNLLVGAVLIQNPQKRSPHQYNLNTMSPQKYTVKTPNPLFTGVRMGIQFTDGKAVCDRADAVKLVQRWGYQCDEITAEHQQIDDTLKAGVVGLLNEDPATEDTRQDLAESIVQPIVSDEEPETEAPKKLRSKKTS